MDDSLLNRLKVLSPSQNQAIMEFLRPKPTQLIDSVLHVPDPDCSNSLRTRDREEDDDIEGKQPGGKQCPLSEYSAFTTNQLLEKKKRNSKSNAAQAAFLVSSFMTLSFTYFSVMFNLAPFCTRI